MHDAEPSDSPTSLALRSIFFKMLLKLKFTSPARRMSTATSQTITNAKLGERKFLDTTHGRIYYHERGPASGEALVFVHGFFTNSTLWADVVESLSAKYRCISPDLPFGAHQDPMHPDADLTPKGMANILRDIIRDPRLGLTTPPAVVGNDTGGAIIQIALADDHTLASRVVLTPCDCFENFPPKDFAFLPYAAALPGFGTLFANVRHRLSSYDRTSFLSAVIRRLPRPLSCSSRIWCLDCSQRSRTLPSNTKTFLAMPMNPKVFVLISPKLLAMLSHHIP
jgi:pimeloyl-ACP methyl ester carboxylesterase